VPGRTVIELPPAVPRPCSDCPWRRNAIRGWLGPTSAEGWIEMAHGEQPIACHQTIPAGMDDEERTPEEKWTETHGLRQCAGAAIFRRNVAKRPHNPTDAANSVERDTEHVFGWDDEFLAHHKRAR
jgi:hypothetical protein